MSVKYRWMSLVLFDVVNNGSVDGWKWRRSTTERLTETWPGIMDHRSSIIDHTAHWSLTLIRFVLHASCVVRENETTIIIIIIHVARRCPDKRENICELSKRPLKGNKNESHAALILISFQALDPTSGFYSIASSIWATLGDSKLHDTGRLEKLNSETRLLQKCDFVIAYEERILTSCAILTYSL